MVSIRRGLRLMLPLLLLLGSTAPLVAQEYRAVVRLQPRTVPVALDTIAVSSELEAPPARVFGAVRHAFESLGIKVEVEDSAHGLIGNEKLVRRLNLAGEPLSRYFNCGSSIVGANADRYRLTIAVAAFVDPWPGGGTRLGLATTAMGRDVEGASLDPVGCETTGHLENRLATLIKANLLPGMG